MRSLTPFQLNGILPLQVSLSTDDVRVVGFPVVQGSPISQGMHEGSGSSFVSGNFSGNVLSYPIRTKKGMSGGPILSSSTKYVKGVHGYDDTINGVENGAGVLFDGNVLSEITSWLWSPTGDMIINNPANNIVVNLVEISAFEAVFDTFNRVDIYGNGTLGKDVDEYIEWSSDLNGDISTGAIVPSNVLKTKLTAGTHNITAKIDSNGEEGEKTVRVTIEVPTGSFTSADFCIIDLGSNPLNSCQLNISWSVTNTPATSVVWNETDNSEFATGNSGNLPFTATTNTNEN